MTSEKKKYSQFARRKIKGEPWVWLSGGSVAIGIAMIVGMIALIGLEGTSTFWPKDVEAIVLGEARYNVGHPELGQVWLAQDSKTVVLKDENALRTLQDKPSKILTKGARLLTTDDYLAHKNLFENLDQTELILTVKNELLYGNDGHSITPEEFTTDPAAAVGASVWKDLTAKHGEDISAQISHHLQGKIFIDTENTQLLLKSGWREVNGESVSLDFKNPRPATVADFREYRNVFEGDMWLLFTTQGQPVNDENGTPFSAQTYLDKPEEFASPWGVLNEKGEHQSIELITKDDSLRDHVLVVGTVRSDREMDIRQLPLSPDGTPYEAYQLEETPQELLIRQGNQGDGLYSRGRYFSWVRTGLPDLNHVRAASPETYAQTALRRVKLPGVVMIERLERGNLVGYIKAVTVDEKVIANIENDGQEKVWKAFIEQQAKMREGFLARYAIEKDELGDVNFALNDLSEQLKLVRHENKKDRDFLVAMDALDKAAAEWTGQEPMDKNYPDQAHFTEARKEWLTKLEPLLGAWDKRISNLELAEFSEPISRARAIVIERSTIHANEFLPLRFKANEMRRAEQKASYTFVTTDGKEAELLLFSVVRAFRPNELDTFGKFGVYFDRVWEYLTDDPREANTEGGIWPVIVGTVIMVLIMTLVVVPFGVVAALYLREYAKQGLIVSAVRIAVNNLAGMPSIVFGIFG
ncbi:MAG: hypothetical protein L3J82_06330, partial [Planctomycetes bacterium]|nr:hypothetical protein [Planctomycetota bacterium]